MRKIEKVASEVKSKEDFLKFVSALHQDLKDHSGDWENKNLDSYLQGIQSWVEDMEGYYINNNLPVPDNVTWKVFADILMAARIYE